jgi:hypothetical protein
VGASAPPALREEADVATTRAAGGDPPRRAPRRIAARANQRQWIEMTVLAQDPVVTGADGRPLMTQVHVPADYLAPGPRSHRFFVVDYDAAADRLGQGLEVKPGWSFHDRFRRAARRDPESAIADPAFHAQMVYAIAARTLGLFEQALGRRVPWSFPDHQLFLVPHAIEEENAFYSPEDRAILFGWFRGVDDRPVHTCLSHDIIAHETTHAILDGLRPGFEEPGLPDQQALHEALADVVALLSVISLKDIVQRVLRGAAPGRSARIPASEVSVAALRRSVLTGVGEQFGRGVGLRGRALRQSADWTPDAGWQSLPEYEEPHQRGEVLVWVMLNAVIEIWHRRLLPIVDRDGTLDRDRAAEEGAKAAGHVLGMSIRAIDYCPPVEVELEDFAAALLRADQVAAPDDAYGYRRTIQRAFERAGLRADPGRIADLRAWRPRGAGQRRLEAPGTLNFGALRRSEEEVFRFIWANARGLGLGADRDVRLVVGPVALAERVGPDGLIVSEVVACYVQDLELTVAELPPEAGAPGGLDPATEVQLRGGGVIVFDQYGQARFHVAKPLGDWERQGRRLRFLARHGMLDTLGRLGFSTGAARGQRFATLHLERIDDLEGFG